MNWRIKSFNELTNEEIYNILMIRSEVFVVEQKCIYQDCDGKDINAYHLFLEDNGKILAYLRILNKGISYDEISFGRVLVNKECRRDGIASEMMKRAINFVQDELKEKEIRISAQQYLIDFYRGHGFKQVSEMYLEDDIPHIEMIL